MSGLGFFVCFRLLLSSLGTFAASIASANVKKTFEDVMVLLTETDHPDRRAFLNYLDNFWVFLTTGACHPLLDVFTK